MFVTCIECGEACPSNVMDFEFLCDDCINKALDEE